MVGIEKIVLFEILGVMLLNLRELMMLFIMGGKNIEFKMNNYLCVINICYVERVFFLLEIEGFVFVCF